MATLSRFAALDLFAYLFPNLVEWKHPHVPIVAKSASVGLKTDGQTDKNIQEVVAFILKESGCRGCGRAARLSMDFVTQPAEDLTKNGVIDAEFVGFSQ
jgi:hypothetical protein